MSLLPLFPVQTIMAAMLLPQRETPTWRTHSENYFLNNFLMNRTIDSSIISLIVHVIPTVLTFFFMNLVHARRRRRRHYHYYFV